MELFDRLDGHAEVLLPLWGAEGRARELDRTPPKKRAFWSLVDREHRRLERAALVRTRVPGNVLRADHITAPAGLAERLSATDHVARMSGGMALHPPRIEGRTGKPGRLEPPPELEGKMEECAPQMFLRPLPRVEREIDDYLPLEPHPAAEGGMPEGLERARADARRSLAPRLLGVLNMDVIKAHRRFHNHVLHQIDWTTFLSKDKLDKTPGPAWSWRKLEGWEPLLDPIPHEERPPVSGYLLDGESPVELD